MRVLDLFCGRFGWSREFAARGWDCFGVDLVEHPAADGIYCLPSGCKLIRADVLDLMMDGSGLRWGKFGPGRLIEKPFDFICASSPCEEFSKWGLRCFFPSPPHPEMGIRLFNHTRDMCEASGVPYIMENVRAAQRFVGNAVHHCGPFYLWGNGVPPIMPQGIIKGMTRKALGHYDYKGDPGWNTKNESAKRRQNQNAAAGLAATIPPELANCVADYAERLIEQKEMQLEI
jgi:hypothetical protein